MGQQDVLRLPRRIPVSRRITLQCSFSCIPLNNRFWIKCCRRIQGHPADATPLPACFTVFKQYLNALSKHMARIARWQMSRFPWLRNFSMPSLRRHPAILPTGIERIVSAGGPGQGFPDHTAPSAGGRSCQGGVPRRQDRAQGHGSRHGILAFQRAVGAMSLRSPVRLELNQAPVP